MRAYKVTVSDTPILLIAADNINRVAYLSVVGTKDIALGNSNVTFATGLLIEKHSAPLQFQIPLGESLWAISDTALPDDVRVLLPDAD